MATGQSSRSGSRSASSVLSLTSAENTTVALGDPQAPSFRWMNDPSKGTLARTRMSDRDQIKPYHAPDASSGQETADVVADVLRHAAERDEAASLRAGPKPQPKWMLPLAMNMGLLAVYFLVAQPSWTTVNPIQPPPAQEQAQSLRLAIAIEGIGRIDGFLLANGRLPRSLEEAGAGGLDGMVEYVVRGDATYALIATVGEEVIAYDSATMTPEEFTGPFTLPG